MGNRFLRAGVEVDRYGSVPSRTIFVRMIFRSLVVDDGNGSRVNFPPDVRYMLHIFEPVEDGQTRGANQFYSVMERLKMLDSLQATQLQS